jgi:hypothetical protein
MQRVLRASGRLLFVEHGIAPEPRVPSWKNWLTQHGKRISGGCHLNRPIRSMIEAAEFN